MSALPLSAAVDRFLQNEERFKKLLNETGGYVDAQGVSVPTWKDLKSDIDAVVKNAKSVVTFLDVGMDPTGVNNNSLLLNNLITSATAEGKTIYGPPGVYRFNATISYISNMKMELDPNCIMMFYVNTTGGVNGCFAPRFSVDATPSNWELTGGVFRKPDRGRLFKPGVGSTIYNGNTLVLMGRNYKVKTTVDTYTGRAVNIHNSFDFDVSVDCFNPRPTGQTGSENDDTGPGGIRIFSGQDGRVHDCYVESGDDAFQFVPGDVEAAEFNAPIVRCSYDRCRGYVYVGRLMVTFVVGTAGIKPQTGVIDCSFRDVKGIASNYAGIEVYSAGTANTEEDFDAEALIRSLIIDDCSVIGVDTDRPPLDSLRRGHGMRMILGGRGSEGVVVRDTNIEGFIRSAVWVQNSTLRDQIGRVVFENCRFGKCTTGNRTILMEASSDIIFTGCTIEGPDPKPAFASAVIVQTDRDPPGRSINADCRNVAFEKCDFTNLHAKTVVAALDFCRNFSFRKNRYRGIEDGAKLFVLNESSDGIVEMEDFTNAYLTPERVATLTNAFSFVTNDVVARVNHPDHGITAAAIQQGVLVEFTPSITTGTLTNPFKVTAHQQGVTVNHVAHGRSVGDVITFSGVTNFAGLPMNLNGSFDIVSVTPNSYELGTDVYPSLSNNAFGGEVSYSYSRRIFGFRFDKIFKVAFLIDANNYAVYLPRKLTSSTSNVGGTVEARILPYGTTQFLSSTQEINLQIPHNRFVKFQNNKGFNYPVSRMPAGSTEAFVTDNGGVVYVNSPTSCTVTLKSFANASAITVGYSTLFVRLGAGNVNLVVEDSDVLITSNGITTLSGVGDSAEVRLVSQVDGVRTWFARIVT